MDERKALASGTILEFPGMQCIIEKEIGRGSNSIVYQGKYPDQLLKQEWHTVLIKELFPLHKRGAIYRSDSGNIVIEENANLLWNDHLASFEKGNKAHLRMLGRFPAEMSANINTYPLNNTFYSVLGFTGGRSLLEDSQNGTESLRHIAVRLLNLLDALSSFHKEGYLHLDIAPDNILLMGIGNRERVMLIDYNSVHYIEAGIVDEGTLSIKAGYTAPEIRTGNLAAISQASDIYSVSAVFYYMLTGSVLTSFQMSRPFPPDVSNTASVKEQPDTVRNMIKNILMRGLATLSRRRYQSTAEMREDVEELLDRIDGIGITHCSLWEAGRQSVLRTIRNNASLSYLRDDTEIFKLNVLRASGQIESASVYLESLKKTDGYSAMLIGEGGAGKTTELLRFVLSSQEEYSPYEPAILYVSLFGRKNSGIRLLDLILENLMFKKDTGSFEEARQTLKHLLDVPLRSARGEVPALILLIDGVNEYSGSTDELLAQIKELLELSGLRLLITGRNSDDSFGIEQAALQGLSDDNIRNELNKRGLAPPESQEMKELLKNPLMLSIFIRSALAKGGQLLISTREELLEVYFSTIFEKETAILPEESDERWLLDASIRLVLPAIAQESKQKRHPLDEAELLNITKRQYDLLGGRALLRLFPEWTGRTKAIKAGADNAEEWYGIVVKNVLWKRMAFLVKTDTCTYRVQHEIIGDYLSAIDRKNVGKLRIRRRIYRITTVLILTAVIAFCVWKFWPEPALKAYDETIAEVTLANGEAAYQYSSQQAEELSKLVESLDNPQEFDEALELYELAMAGTDTSSKALIYGNRTVENIRKLLESGEVFSQSGEPLDEKYYLQLINLETERQDEYHSWADMLNLLIENDLINQKYGEEYRSSLDKIISWDAEITGVLYYLAIFPHSAELIRTDKKFSDIHYSSEFQDAHNPKNIDHLYLEKDLNDLLENRKTLEYSLNRMVTGMKDLYNRVN